MIISENFDIIYNNIEHSYINTPPGYSTPQKLYNFSYKGSTLTEYIWSVDPPFFILTGQNTPKITCELIPKLSKNKECNFSILKLNNEESITINYTEGPKWKIEGNKNPKIEMIDNKYIPTVETYTLIPQYDQTGYPPKNSTDPNSYNLNIKNGKIVNFHGGIPPTGNPTVDIEWFNSGSSYLSFYSSWTNGYIKYPNTLDIYISVNKNETQLKEIKIEKDKTNWHPKKPKYFTPIRIEKK